MDILPWLDIAGVALPLAQAIGRWANFVNQELYGTVTTLPWGITIDANSRVAPYESLVDYPASTLFHPLFLYESLWSLLAFIVLMQVFTRYRSRLLKGDIFLLYVMQYAVIRFLLEFLRVEVTLVGGVNWSQVVSVVLFVLALAVFIYRHRPGAARRPESAQAAGS
jgi:phosphatidylglycerol:prolipoprotein diacylglycerol transferase